MAIYGEVANRYEYFWGPPPFCHCSADLFLFDEEAQKNAGPWLWPRHFFWPSRQKNKSAGQFVIGRADFIYMINILINIISIVSIINIINLV